jgi:hypothetical protein
MNDVKGLNVACILILLFICLSGCETATSQQISTPSMEPLTPAPTILQTETSTPTPPPTNSTPQSSLEGQEETIAQLTPYDILNKIRGIEHFSGGTFDGLRPSFDKIVLAFSIQVIFNKDENEGIYRSESESRSDRSN